MLFRQNSSSSFVSLLIILGSYQKTLFSISWYMFLVKRRTRGPIAKWVNESCPVIFASCLGVKTFCIKIFFISAKSLLIFSEGTVNVIWILSIIVPNHFPFVLGLKLLFSALIANPTETRSFWWVHSCFGKIETTRCCNTVIDIKNSLNADTSPTLSKWA